jgi:hypothetical protein
MGFGPGSAIGFLLLHLRVRIDRARASEEVGASTIEWVIITGVLVALAACVGVIIYQIVRNRAESVNIPADPPAHP